MKAVFFAGMLLLPMVCSAKGAALETVLSLHRLTEGDLASFEGLYKFPDDQPFWVATQKKKSFLPAGWLVQRAFDSYFLFHDMVSVARIDLQRGSHRVTVNGKGVEIQDGQAVWPQLRPVLGFEETKGAGWSDDPRAQFVVAVVLAASQELTQPVGKSEGSLTCSKGVASGTVSILIHKTKVNFQFSAFGKSSQAEVRLKALGQSMQTKFNWAQIESLEDALDDLKDAASSVKDVLKEQSGHMVTDLKCFGRSDPSDCRVDERDIKGRPEVAEESKAWLQAVRTFANVVKPYNDAVTWATAVATAGQACCETNLCQKSFSHH